MGRCLNMLKVVYVNNFIDYSESKDINGVITQRWFIEYVYKEGLKLVVTKNCYRSSKEADKAYAELLAESENK